MSFLILLILFINMTFEKKIKFIKGVACEENIIDGEKYTNCDLCK